MSREKKIVLIAIIILLLIGIVIAISLRDRKIEEKGDKLNIVTTTFSCYDFSRQIVGDKANVNFLLGPGVEAHSYDPSAQDLIKIQNADVFIYIGGEMERWVEKILEVDTIDLSKVKLIKVTDCVETIEEIDVDGAEPEEEKEESHGAFDEHIWASPENAKKMVKYLSEKFAELDDNNRAEYERNAESYIEKIADLQDKIKEIVDNKKRDRLVFGDKMPMQYFLNEYGLTASAAFNGCSSDAEPSVKTITYLVNKVKEENIPVVLYIELSTGKTAKSIANETGAKALQIQTLHNISKQDFEKGESYVTLMTRNLEVLREALQ